MRTHATKLSNNNQSVCNSFIGIDYHKRYSVYCVIDPAGEIIERGRIEHATPQEFIHLLRRHEPCEIVFEASMNWHWLYELLEKKRAEERITLANPFKTRIIAEAHAYILAQSHSSTAWRAFARG